MFSRFAQNIKNIPDNLKKLYKTVWEISQKTILEMAAARGPYIDQSQSLNIHIAQPTYAKLTSMHFYAWNLVSALETRLLPTLYLSSFSILSSSKIGLDLSNQFLFILTPLLSYTSDLLVLLFTSSSHHHRLLIRLHFIKIK